MSSIVTALISLAASGAAAEAPSHADEISFLAKTMAIARTVKESCPGIAPDDRFLEALRQRLHVVEGDHLAFAEAAHAAAGVLQHARDTAPSRQAWCDAVFRLYGPDGKLMRGMLSR